jgi:hypothetical protein
MRRALKLKGEESSRPNLVWLEPSYILGKLVPGRLRWFISGSFIMRPRQKKG